MAGPLRTLLFSTLYPSTARPGHGIFVETRLRELLAAGAVSTRVVAPVPWFWSTDPRHGEWARMAATSRYEMRHGIEVHHPRYALPPRVGMTVAPLLLALGAAPTLRRLRAEGFDFELIDAHYYYPDGVAAALLARWFDRPFVVTARGTDLNLIPRHRLPRRMMQWTARQAAASIGVCAALVDVLRGWDIDPQRLHVMRNGVDLQRFAPQPAAGARSALGVDGMPLLVSVGHLIERKGHHLVIEALALLLRSYPDAQLVIIGEGEERGRLERQIDRLGLGARVRLAGALPQAELPRWYAAADALVLASSREGWANVLLEAMACGTPVVATRIWGTPEVVQGAVAGRLVERDTASIAAGVEALLSAYPKRAEVRAYAEGFGWQETSAAQLALFRAIAGRAGNQAGNFRG